jgi:lipopolysaccharide/colanic/teichoic acid biosynthesis glycosyltransferase
MKKCDMYRFIKRLFDILFSTLLIFLVSPIMIPIIIGLRLTGEGYIFYLQERVGYNNSLFKIIKFATMLKDSPNMKGGVITTQKDPRITPMGHFLRKSKLNELPQLLNVLLGHMSFVGPRPVMQISFEQYPPEVKEVIYNAKPGITGVGSIIFRDEERLITEAKSNGIDPWDMYTQKIYPYKGKVERWYQERQSFTVDFTILLLTAWVIIFPDSDAIYRVFPSIHKRDF